MTNGTIDSWYHGTNDGSATASAFSKAQRQ